MKKNIHIINPYGTLPNEGWRKYRTNIVAEYFANHGFNVTYWISNIDHRSKKKRSEEDTDIEINTNLTFKIVKSPEYSGNGSFQRIIYEKGFSRRVKEIFLSEDLVSDIIIVTDPALFYGQSIYKIVKKTGSKFFIDILDLWPEVFITLFPRNFKWVANILLSPLYYLRWKLFRKADGFIAVTHDYLEVAQKACPDKPGEVVYIGIDGETPKNIKKVNIDKAENEKWIVYAGTLGINYDIKTIIQLAQKLEASDLLAKLIIAGDGPAKDEIENVISKENLHKTLFLGRLNAEKLNDLYSKCDIALSTYLSTSTVSLPVKAFDYIAFGLPVLNSLGREYSRLVKDKMIGLQYIPENADDLFKQCKIILSNEILLETMKNNALKLSNEFEVKNQYEKYINFVKNNI
ncbi:TPA: glycosyltransferase family 4 protein [Elizabethkingia anophelis]|uniref:glycosyltransferase family 4 protein n=1 Tax=Elizabethkingia anophelis TaxID=1117645 RepID=UPI0013656FE8|nr:glycosyltransferase family 4 protein [Elizabethkingia anophelis]MCT3982042.1 glycosyltransferase family 4 protein [Elizabethkingia anophelis]MDV4014601.1 glycosyltransferase WbuB [Elizabethkingia anophelis]MVW83312.1 glycosyltransferase family 4 protein [Elizabethkingia anophelis]